MTITKLFPFILAGMISNDTPSLLTGDVYYVLVVDVGSTGSRIHAYKFSLPTGKHRQNSQNKLLLDDELYVAIKPELSSYITNPMEGAESIVGLVKKVNPFVPKQMRAKTQLVVRATAGFRLLPKTISGNILLHVRNAIANLGYKVTQHSVDILQGKDEGINMWYAVNLLTDSLGKKNPWSSLEMGGVSTQVTFALNTHGNSNHLSKDEFVRPAVFNRTLFSHSYQGLGIDEARFGTLQLEAGDVKTERFISVCVGPMKYKTNIFGRNVQISGISREGYSPKEVYLRCRKFVKKYIKATMRNSLRLSSLNKLAAMGYYYHFANNEGLIPQNRNGKITIQKLLAHAIGPTGGCAAHDKENPWRCFDAVFIISLLRSGFGINKNTIIHLYHTIDGYGVEWSLGIAYNYLMAEITTKPGLSDVHNYLQSILFNSRK